MLRRRNVRSPKYADIRGGGFKPSTGVETSTWWILEGLVLMPILLGMSPFAPLMMPPMRMVAMGSLVGHLVYGVILGGAFAWLRHGARSRAPA